jgi:hypothetical protein
MRLLGMDTCPSLNDIMKIPYMVHLIYTYLTLFSVLASYLYKLDNI